ncbi:basic helix-loop-helix protein [Coemansia biformis]|uniref:Basic helix-loop-helix protein n=1 Tax=Coemansia biformis TaxID=1286918 RepID=A0A9W7XV15_9FUNG|nr:basic helix-loop-helix protein [Coemansia biformis]
MSTSSPSSSVLLTVEDKGPSTRGAGQYTAIAPRGTGGPTAIAPAPESRTDGFGGEGDIVDDEVETGDGMVVKRRRGSKDVTEPGSPEWHRLRRDSHKEVERRRREVINGGIDRLADLVPGAEKNKGRIIAQAVDYIHRLRTNEEKNIEKWTIEKLLADQAIAELTSQVEQLRAENKQLREWVDAKGGPVGLGEDAAADADDADLPADEHGSADGEAEPGLGASSPKKKPKKSKKKRSG